MSIAKGVALITGSAQGIGRSIALRLARDGFDIGLNDIPSKKDQLCTVASKIENVGRKAHLVPGDVTIEDDVKGMVHGVAEELGGLDVMVANAGLGTLVELVSTKVEKWEQIMAVNASGVFLCYKHAAARMIAQGRGGRIIGASSAVGKSGFPGASAYSASKFAVRGLTQSAALELGRYGITVNSYAPGVIETPMSASGTLEKLDEGLAKRCSDIISGRPIKHNGQPEDVASVVSYLASKEAHFITGQCVSFSISDKLTIGDGIVPLNGLTTDFRLRWNDHVLRCKLANRRENMHEIHVSEQLVE